MKKRAYLTALAAAMAFMLTACGSESAKESGKEDTNAVGEQQISKEETAKTEENEPSGFGTRLVSVENVEKYISMADYKGLALENAVQEITDELIDQQITYDLQGSMEEVNDSEATAQAGDLVTINFVGMKDGVAFEGGAADNYDLTLGQGGMIAGFEEGIMGMKKGETRDLDLTFPENYFEASLAGEPVVFQITLQKIQRIPEVTDKWVAKHTDVSTVEEYRGLVKAQLQEKASIEAHYALKSTAWNMVLMNSEVVEYPEADIRNAKDEFEKQVMNYAGDTELTLEEFVESQGLSLEAFQEQCQQYAESKVKQNLIIQGIMDAEGMTLEDQECLDIQNEMIDVYGVTDLAQLIDYYGQAAVDEAIGLLRIEDFLIENANIEDTQSTAE